jgi:uncharacterized protein YcbK (DUF882 family)
MTDFAKFFKRSELECKCCGDAHMVPAFMMALDMLREESGFPFIVTSGYRCKKHNKQIGGVLDSTHTKGTAVDIKLPISTGAFHKFIRLATAFGFNIGIYPASVHLDLRDRDPDNYFWVKHEY